MKKLICMLVAATSLSLPSMAQSSDSQAGRASKECREAARSFGTWSVVAGTAGAGAAILPMPGKAAAVVVAGVALIKVTNSTVEMGLRCPPRPAAQRGD